MDSFFGLFDPSDNNNWDANSESNVESSSGPKKSKALKKTARLLTMSCHNLPPEPQLGNIEYKLKLVNPSKQKFEHLVTQMKWRLREGQGEAIYEIGVADSGRLEGLSDSEMRASLQTLQQMAFKLGATTTILRQKTVGDFRSVAEVLVRKVPDDQHNIEIRVAVMGSADAGKSTLLGVLTQGQLDNGRGRARLNMFRHLHEVQSGRTSSISHEILGFDSQGNIINYNYSEMMTAEEICDMSAKLITFMDLAGHRKYLRTTVQGLTGYSPHHAMLVVSGSVDIGSMAHEHLALVIALDVPVFIVITKIDLISPSETINELSTVLKSVGCRKVPLVVENEDDVMTASQLISENIVPIFCCSSVSGLGLDLLTKFLHVLPPGVSNTEKERLEQQLCEFQIDETFKVAEVGNVVGGLLVCGVLTEGSKMLIGPLNDGSFMPVTVQSLHRNRAPCRVVRATQSASLGLSIEPPGLRSGMVLLPMHGQPRGTYFFQAYISVIFHATAIYPGFQTTVHIGSVRQTAVIEGIMGSESLETNDTASVLFRFKRHPEYVTEGMRVLFREGKTKGIGKVTQVFPL
ncbi:GTP-binding protein 2-like [Ctenocephalides felis]|uniref:GTP-binding protein 2-like n=1 Tax=Ctenocephalides felis TaxID=7515 RepID=UPI000E6E2BE7|nr:GTP-binding protein 2-like [Ctenocephalides felis]